MALRQASKIIAITGFFQGKSAFLISLGLKRSIIVS